MMKWLFLVSLVGLWPAAAGAAPLGNVMPVLDQATATGPTARDVGGAIQLQNLTVPLTDTLDATGFRAPRDTVPSQSSFQFNWHAEPLTPGAVVVGYRYGIGVDQYAATVTVDSSVHSASFGPQALGAARVFALVAIDDQGGERQITRRFLLNFAPDVWFAGPDLALFPIVPGSGGQRYIDLPSWTLPPPTFPGTLLSCDSLALRPAERTPRKTFFEFYGNRIYARAENDTVDRNSWVVFPTGGSDLDSPYLVKLSPAPLGLPDTVDCTPPRPPWTVRPDGLNGSPIGFRNRCAIALDPSGVLAVPAASSLYPNYDPFSVFYLPNISGYTCLVQSGKAYMVVMPVDGDGLTNPIFASLADARQLADSVDAGLDTRPESIALRSKIMTFYVNRNPYFVFSAPGFRPKPPEFNGGAVYTYATRTLQLNLLATDPNPFDPGSPVGPGGPAPTGPLTYTVTVHAANLGGASYTAPTSSTPSFSIDLASVAPWIVSQDLTLTVDLCNCAACDQAPGSGRCVEYTIPVTVGPPVSAVDPPHSFAFALEGVRPNPAMGDLTLAFSLPDGRPAALEVFDTSGRRVLTRQAVGAGPHALGLGNGFAPGVYLVRLSHEGRSLHAKFAVVR